MEDNLKQKFRKDIADLRQYLLTAGKWVLLGGGIGILCGLAGSVFHRSIELGQELHAEYPWLIFALPVIGLAICALYGVLKLVPDPGTNAVLVASATGKPLSVKMAMAIFVSTVLTQLGGGSAGREGAALQLGGSIASHIGEELHMSNSDRRIITLCGMSAVFSALFGTPVTAVLFCMEVARVGRMPYAALVPCLISSMVANNVSEHIGMVPTAMVLSSCPDATTSLLARTAVLGLLCALVSALFCHAQHIGHWAFDKIKNRYVRMLVGSGILIVLTLAVGSQRYNGAGMAAVAEAVEQGTSTPLSFLLKILFTAITLSCGFKGGEIVPAFFTGATFGCVVGPLLGLDPGFAAAVGMVCVFCGVVNCPLASLMLAVEVFGGGMLAPVALPVAICYLISGTCSLYSSQTLMESKMWLETFD